MKAQKFLLLLGAAWILLGLGSNVYVVEFFFNSSKTLQSVILRNSILFFNVFMVLWGITTIRGRKNGLILNLNISLIIFLIFSPLALSYYVNRQIPPTGAFLGKHGPGITQETDYYMGDNMAGHVHRPYAKRVHKWPEAESGRIIITTNNLGFREDQDTAIKKAPGSKRIFVTGDSHTDGVVENSKSFANVFEQKLNSEAGIQAEVINGGVGSYTLKNYLGFMRRFAHLKPDVFIVTIYMGNDFLEMARFINPEERKILRDNNLITKIESLTVNHGPIMAQALNQATFFRSVPEALDQVLINSYSELSAMRDTARQAGAKFMVVLLPTKLSVEWDKDRNRLDGMAEVLGLTEKDYNSLDRSIRNQLTGFLEEEQIKFIDLTDKMSDPNQEMYWKKDYHLSTAGHQRAGELLYKYYQDNFLK